MTPEQISALINQLLKTGEILATKTFELAVRQVYVNALGEGFTVVFLVIVGFLLWKFSKKATEDDSKMIVTCFSWLAWLLAFLPAYSGLSYLLNPQWYAVKILLETFIG